VNVETPEKRLIQAGRKTRDALRSIRDMVRSKRKANLYDTVFADLESAVEEATDGLIEISNVFEEVIHKDPRTSASQETRSSDVMNLHDLQASLVNMRAERATLIENLQDAKEQLQRYADDLQTLYAQEREKRAELATAYERLQEADRLKSDFLSNINHELTSPLVPIDLFMQYLGKYPLDEDQRQNLEDAQKNLSQYKRLVDGLVKYAALVSQSHVMQPQSIDINAMLEDTLEPLYMLARGRDITLEVYPFEFQMSLIADPNLVSSAIYQISHNAIRYNKPGGHVKITVQMVDGGILFEIEDDGPGIPDKVMERLGQDFNQLVDALRRGVEGLGLGLALATYVASTHDGTLTAHSRDGRGTIIRLWLPQA
jgi:signal transduction histidine kinase